MEKQHHNMIIIADSGSSKTDWLILKEKELLKKIETSGINPFFQDTEEIIKMLSPVFSEMAKSEISEIFFYGAGCIKGKSDTTIIKALEKVFPTSQIEVEDDMLGAARAVLGKNEGIACILGTGANSCYYNGVNIIDKVPTLGFILGDEGSGAHIGKFFLNDYFKRALPKDIQEKAEKELALEMPEVLTAVYKGEYPSRYLSQFSKFLAKNKTHVYTHNLIKRSFSEFFFRNIERYNNYKNVKVNFVGSIAFNYSAILKEVAFEREIEIGKIIEKPIDGLKIYHTSI